MTVAQTKAAMRKMFLRYGKNARRVRSVADAIAEAKVAEARQRMLAPSKKKKK
jgi:hypothetical protein